MKQLYKNKVFSICITMRTICSSAMVMAALSGFAVFAQETGQPGLQTVPPQPPLRRSDNYHPAHVRLRQVVYRESGQLRPKEDVDVSRLLQAVRDAHALIDEQHLWGPDATEEQANYGWLVYSDLRNGLLYAWALAQTEAEKRLWILKEQALTVRLMHFLLETRQRHPDYFRFAWKDRAVLARLADDLRTTRLAMSIHGVIRPEEWGMLYGLRWVDQPGTVVVRNGVVYVDSTAISTLLANEPVFRPHVPGVLPKPRKARIPIGSPSQAGSRQGYRDDGGCTYLPVEELHRQGQLTATILPRHQMVLLDVFIYRDPANASEEKPKVPSPR